MEFKKALRSPSKETYLVGPNMHVFTTLATASRPNHAIDFTQEGRLVSAQMFTDHLMLSCPLPRSALASTYLTLLGLSRFTIKYQRR